MASVASGRSALPGAQQQLTLVPLEVPVAARRAWLALPFRDQRACSSCGATDVTTAGKRRSSQRCLACFTARKRGGPSAGRGLDQRRRLLGEGLADAASRRSVT